MNYTTSRSRRRESSDDGFFICRFCGSPVNPGAPGTRQRNHCPFCLHSLHVDITPGDRRELCRGLMEPIGLWVREGGDTAILHRCRKCGAIRSNRVAGDDDEEALKALAEKALKAVVAGGG
ncbi:MAG: RNHCP domain-containing protein [Spirochaetales bacterium]|nr:RNHCP domain-containing protein [Spirochaetales bacterium]